MWYFAYGSNMQSDTLHGRRGIVFRRALAVRAPGWRVVFDKPPLIPIGESFANIVPDPDGAALGVAFEVDEQELAHIELTEGVLVGNYQRVIVRVEPLVPQADAPDTAVSLSSDRRDATLRPSKRYMGLLIAGAQEHGLPADYIDLLRRVSAGESSAAARAFRTLIDSGLRSWRQHQG